MKQLIGNWILVSPKEPISQLSSGLFIVDTLKEDRNVGTVTHIGTTVDPSLLGKEVMFNLMAARNFSYGDIKGKSIFTVDIIATLN